MKSINIYTDGSSRGNPGPSGWGSIIINEHEKSVVELGGREDIATNNKMELFAVYQSLLYIESKRLFDLPVVFFIDSSYVQKGITLWMYGWEKNGWKTRDGGAVLNQEIWVELVFLVFRLKRKMEIEFKKIEGHAGHFGNECADRVATSFADNKPTPLFKGEFTLYEKLYKNTMLSVPAKGKSKEGVVPPKKTGKAYSYVSCVNGVVTVDTDWASCEKRVKGYKGTKYKKVFSKIEEIALVDEYKKS